MHEVILLPPAAFANPIGYIERGEVAPIVAGTFPLSATRRAQETFAARRHVGSWSSTFGGRTHLGPTPVSGIGRIGYVGGVGERLR